MSTVPLVLRPETRAELARAVGHAKTWTAKRDEIIMRARAEGASLRDIAEVIGITHVGVKKLVERIEKRGS